jgi:hypothetical protein
MASVVINNNAPVVTKIIEEIRPINTTIDQPTRGVRINSILPFRVRFTSIQIPSSSGNIPAIPLQVIGYSNYIL